MQKLVIHEVGPRDGLQIEKHLVPLEKKISWIEKLIHSGVDIIQAGSFVHPDRVPQMATTDAIFRHFRNEPLGSSTILSALVLNEKGLERGLECGVAMFCMGVSASDTHSRKNSGMSTEEATVRIIAIAKRAAAADRQVQLSVQSAFGCGYEGAVPEERVLDIVKRYLDAGFRRISLADTAGHASPQQVETLFGAITSLEPGIESACHFHDTYGMAMANCWAALRAGVTSFESAFGGLGGCPFTRVSGGNVPTEDLIHMLQRMGWRTDIDLDPVFAVVAEAEDELGRDLPGVIHRTGPIAATDREPAPVH
jgi:hydroxymethylglutaryl-CoA lyase